MKRLVQSGYCSVTHEHHSPLRRRPTRTDPRRRGRRLRPVRVLRRIDERHRRGGGRHQASAVPALRLEERSLLGAPRRSRQPHARRHREGDGRGTNGREQTELGFQAYFRWVSHRHDEFMLLFGGTLATTTSSQRRSAKITATRPGDGAADLSRHLRSDTPHPGSCSGRAWPRVEPPPGRVGRVFDPDQIAPEVIRSHGPACATPAPTAPGDRGRSVFDRLCPGIG